ncbi:MAG: P-loop NTPase [Gemmatimonadetes bacterium]|nr:P-loop NTPase [Gemmatimonadota bacterium]
MLADLGADVVKVEPPGTGDIAISLAQMLPNADMLVVTTPQQAAQRVALRAGQGVPIQYDGSQMRVTSHPEVNAFLDREPRRGWEL